MTLMKHEKNRKDFQNLRKICQISIDYQNTWGKPGGSYLLPDNLRES